MVDISTKMCGRFYYAYFLEVVKAALELELCFILIQGGIPMTFPETVKSTLWGIIDEMSLSLSSFVKNPNKDFLRKRKLDFSKMMRLIISMESGSLNHELLKFFQYDFSLPTGSAFYQQRAKLSVSAFRHLLTEFNSCFPLEKFRDEFFLIACDGSEFNIARNPNDPDTFHEPNGKSASGFNMIHTISLYELTNKRYLDLEVQPGRLKNEFQAICNLMEQYAYGGKPIFIADRGFASYNVFAHALENNLDFMIRAKDLNVLRFLKLDSLPDSLDTTVELFLTRSQSRKKRKHPEKDLQYRYICKNIAFDFLNPSDIYDEYLLKMRIVRFEVADGIFENIITSLPAEIFTVDDIKYCYHLRWGIETSFRDLKHTIGTINFHSKKTEFIEFELWGRLILYNFCSIIILHVPISRKSRKHEYQVNFSLAMKICFDFLRGTAPPDIESLISKYILPIRLERHYARQHRVQKPASFSYRFV